MNNRSIRIAVEVALAAIVAVLVFANVIPSISSPNYWWVVLAVWVLAIGIRLYWRVTTGGWQNPRGRRQRRTLW